MDKEILVSTVKKLMVEPKGILAIDESMGTCKGRFDKLGVPFTEEKRREYRQLLVTAPGAEEYLSGYILVAETAFQKTESGVTFPEILKNKGICVGVTGYTGYSLFNTGKDGVKEEITEGVEDFATRIKDYKKAGAVFSKWREMIRIGGDVPTEEFLSENAKRLVKYAQICQAHDIVPIVEPEVMIDGKHTIEKCYEVTAHNLDRVFPLLQEAGVYMPGVILKTSMVLPGKDAPKQATTEEIADMTLKCLREHVPNDIGGIVFLSGGQKDEEATVRLNAMHQKGELPWRLSFSYGRAIQNPALQAWAKNPADVEGAQKLLLETARHNSLASVGKYK